MHEKVPCYINVMALADNHVLRGTLFDFEIKKHCLVLSEGLKSN